MWSLYVSTLDVTSVITAACILSLCSEDFFYLDTISIFLFHLKSTSTYHLSKDYLKFVRCLYLTLNDINWLPGQSAINTQIWKPWKGRGRCRLQVLLATWPTGYWVPDLPSPATALKYYAKLQVHYTYSVRNSLAASTFCSLPRRIDFSWLSRNGRNPAGVAGKTVSLSVLLLGVPDG